MKFRRVRPLFLALSISVAVGANTGAVAQVFFADPSSSMNFFGNPDDVVPEVRPRVIIRTNPHGRPAARRTQSGFCVRSCDGRFFPISQPGTDSKSCQALCPTAEMSLYSGSSIENARSEKGKTYDSLANAYRFQRGLVPKCSCNLQGQTGMTRISVRDDVTLRSGDIIVEEKGFSVAEVPGRRGGRRSTGIIFRPLAASKLKALGLAHASIR